MKPWVGRYPFDIYGSFVVNADIGFALETQSLSIYDRYWFLETPQGVWDPTMLHELAHQWFGDSVAPLEWSDLWINEGHASWYEFLYAEENGWLADDTENWPDPTGYATLEELMRAIYAHGDQWRADLGPVALPVGPEALFAFQSYHGGALVLYALRQKIGHDAFERLERAWVRRFRGESAGTEDFIALASRVAGTDLSGFLGALALRHRDPADARPPRLDGPAGRGAGAPVAHGRRTRARGAPPLTESKVRAAARRARPARTSSRCCAASRHAARGRTRRRRLGPSPSRSRGESLRAPSPRRRSG